MALKNIRFQSFEPSGIPQPILPIKIINPAKRKTISALGLIDTGAMSCAVPAYLAPSLGHDYMKGHKVKFIGAGGEGIAYAHTTKIEIVVPNTKKVIIETAIINYIEGLPNVLLGVSGFLERFILEIDYSRYRFSINHPAKKRIPPFTTP